MKATVLLACVMIAIVGAEYIGCRVIKKEWPPGHPWSGLALSMLGVCFILEANMADEVWFAQAKLIVLSISAAASIMWIFTSIKNAMRTKGD